jgi:hypothetical protein
VFQRNLIPDLKLFQKVDSQLTLDKQKPIAGKLIVKFVERGILKQESKLLIL